MTDTVNSGLRLQVKNLIAEISDGARIADNVADRLRSRRAKGVQGDACNSPIANLIRTIRGVTDVAVENGMALVQSADDEFAVALPEVVVGFDYLFEAGVYLDLVAMPAVTR